MLGTRPLVTADPKEYTPDPEIPKDGEERIHILPNSADTGEQPVTTRAPPRRSTRSRRHPVKLDPSKLTVKCIKLTSTMGRGCSCRNTKEDLEKCKKKVASLEQLISANGGKTNNMKSSQTNLGILSICVEQSTNDCNCDSV